MSTFDAFYHYLPVSDATMQWGFYLTGAGRAQIPASPIYPPQGHPALYDFAFQRGRTLPEFQLILISDGKGVFESRETGSVAIEPSSVIILFPGVWHRYRPRPQTGWSERWIGFNGETAHRLVQSDLLRPRDALWVARDAAGLAKRFDDLLERIHANPVQNSILVALHGIGLLAAAMQTASAGLPAPETGSQPRLQGTDDPIIVQAMDLIWTHSHRELSVQDVARGVSVTRRTLDRHFKAVLGRSVLDEINNCRMSRAKRMLAETDLTIKTIAYQTGFGSEERMRVQFLQTEKVPPSKYRRRAAQRLRRLAGKRAKP